MSQEEAMRIVAEVVDKFSRPLRQLNEGLRRVDATPGQTRLRQQLRGLRDEIADARKGIAYGLMPAMSALNVRTLSVGGAIAAVGVTLGRSVFQQARAVEQLRLVEKDTGVSINTMRQLGFALEEVGGSADQVSGTMETFARNMQELRAGVGGTYDVLAHQGNPTLREFAEILRRSHDNGEALAKIMREMQFIPDPQARRRFLEAFGLPADLARSTAEQWQEAQQRTARVSKDMKHDAEMLSKSWRDLGRAWDDLQIETAKVGGFAAVRSILKSFTEDLDKVEKAIERTGKTIDLLRQHKWGDAYRNEMGIDPGTAKADDLSRQIAGKQRQLKMLDDGIAMLKSKGQDATATQRKRDVVAGEILDLQRQLRDAIAEGSKKGASEGIQEGIKKMMFEGRGAAGGGGASLIPASYTTPMGSAGGGVREHVRRLRSPSMIPDNGGAAPVPGKMGQYRPVYKLGKADLSDDVVNTIAGEAYTNNQRSVDAVIDNMLNRVGTKAYGPSANLRQVARAPGQYTGYRRASAKEAAYIRERIKAIASGAVPDITGGSNEYRASYYHGPWYLHHPDAPVIGGNRFAFNPRAGRGPYSPIGEAARKRMMDAARGSGVIGGGGKVEGNASVKIDLNGFPRGTKVQTEASGIFKELELNRGRPMAVPDGDY